MRGAAAQDGVVRIGELFDYVCDQVEQATDNRQHPSVGTNSFDQRLPLAITAGVDARDNYRLGTALYELSRFLCDTELLHAAHAQLREGVRLRSLNQEAYPEAQLLQGQIEQEQGNYATAIRQIQQVTTKHPSFDAYFHLGLSFARQGNTADALHAFKGALAVDGEDRRWEWVADYCSTLQAQAKGDFYVLIIGVNFRGKGSFPGHLGFLRRLLMEKYNVPKEKIWGLVNEKATYQGVLAAFAKLRQ
ncbi:MAG: tetratricopeptide repeat protein, partial [Caldilineaceae bacterium]|nr:tetratricopeptide repeat protein [Caldilineaceae bacterium]